MLTIFHPRFTTIPQFLRECRGGALRRSDKDPNRTISKLMDEFG